MNASYRKRHEHFAIQDHLALNIYTVLFQYIRVILRLYSEQESHISIFWLMYPKMVLIVLPYQLFDDCYIEANTINTSALVLYMTWYWTLVNHPLTYSQLKLLYNYCYNCLFISIYTHVILTYSYKMQQMAICVTLSP